MSNIQNILLSNSARNLTDRLEQLHDNILERLPGVARIACALYDEQTDLLKTFINSTRKGHAIAGYEYPLAKSRSLTALQQNNECRVIDEIDGEITEGTGHSDWLLEQKYRSSFTIPMHNGNQFLGFVFIDSDVSGYFAESVQRDLILFTNMITMAISLEVSAVKSLVATAKAARDFADLRDFETGAHLTRMAQFSRLIAKSVSEHFNISDETIEHIYLFAPLHDIGKIGIPDSILLKPGRLDQAEYEKMKQHVTKGVDIISSVLEDYQLTYLDDSRVMVNIVAYHHEFMDGTGYPNGLKGDQIPIESRIITVADIFDALTSLRPYKQPWSVDQALEELKRMAHAGKLDPLCVQAMIDSKHLAEQIVVRHADIA